jgi:hypothetical protein
MSGQEFWSQSRCKNIFFECDRKQVIMQVSGSLLVIAAETNTNQHLLNKSPNVQSHRHAPDLGATNIITMYVNSHHGSDLQLL